MRRHRFVLCLALLAGVLPIVVAGQAPTPGQPTEPGVAQAIVIEPVVPAIRIGAGEPSPSGPVTADPRRGTPVSIQAPAGAQIDQAVQSTTEPVGVEEVGRALDDLSAPITQWNAMGGSNPNDTTGDVGPNHFVQSINSSFQVFDKQGNSLEGPTGLGTLWNNGDGDNTDPCERNSGDPVVLYDNLADRWMIAQFSRQSGTDPNVCLAVSMTADPRLSQGYYSYIFNVGQFPDYLKFSAWTDGYYMSANGAGAIVAVFDRANMLNGNPAGAVQFANVADLPNNSFNVFMPADIDGLTPPPAGTPGFFYRPVDGDTMGGGADRVEIFTATIDWANPAASTLTGPTAISLVAFNSSLCGFLSFGCIPQPGASGILDPVNETGMFRFPYRNYGDREVVAGNFTVNVNTGGGNDAGIRWFILQRTGGGAWSVADQGTYAPQPTGAPAFVHRFMGSLAMDRFGNLALGYTRSSAQHITAGATDGFASAVYTGRLAGDVPGLLPQPEFVIQAGTGALGASGALTRWGDYYTMVVDPVDDCTFWYTGDYATNRRQSVIANFRFSTCATDLRISKTATPSHPNAGDELVYTITVSNLGPLAAQNVVVTDTLPSQVDYLASTEPCTGVAVGATGTLTCTLGTIDAGRSIGFEIKVRVDASLGGATSITNTASVTSDAGEVDAADNTVSLTHLVNESADLRVTKLCKPDSGPAEAGSNGVCTIFVTNDGPSAARAVSLVDTHVSSGPFTLPSATSSQGTCVIAAPAVTCDLLTIQPGQTVQVDITVSSTAGVDVNDVATVTSETPNPNTSNNDASAGLSFSASADLSVAKTGPAAVTAGTNLTYTLTVDNAGPSAAAAVVVTDTLPAGVSFVSAVPSVGTYTAIGGTVTWNLGNVAVADPPRTLDITVQVLPQTTGSLVNNASVISAVANPNSANNLATFTTAVNATASLTLTKTDSPDPVFAGAPLSYTLTVGNSGPSTALAVVVTDAIPAGTSLVGAVAAPGITCAEIQPGIVRCDVGTLNPGQSTAIVLTVLVAASVPQGTILTNTAEATSPTDADGALASASTTVDTQADLWVAKAGIVNAQNPAGPLIYRITVFNRAGWLPTTHRRRDPVVHRMPRTSW